MYINMFECMYVYKYVRMRCMNPVFNFMIFIEMYWNPWFINVVCISYMYISQRFLHACVFLRITFANPRL